MKLEHIGGAGRLPLDEQAEWFRSALGRNQELAEVLSRAADMNLPGWYLVARCLYQTVWNVVTGQPPGAGILDCDLAYFDDRDVSWAAKVTRWRQQWPALTVLPWPHDLSLPVRVERRGERRREGLAAGQTGNHQVGQAYLADDRGGHRGWLADRDGEPGRVDGYHGVAVQAVLAERRRGAGQRG